jgi:hypothetical protein
VAQAATEHRLRDAGFDASTIETRRSVLRFHAIA